MTELFENMNCRLCSSELTEQCVEIFSFDGIKAKISSILQQHFDINVRIGDGSSDRICDPCWFITDNFHALYRLVRQQESKLASVGHCIVETADEAAAENCKPESQTDGASTVTNVYTIKSLNDGPDDVPPEPAIEFLHEIKDELADQISSDLIGVHRSETADVDGVADDVEDEDGESVNAGNDDDDDDRYSDDSTSESSSGRTLRRNASSLTDDDAERIETENALIRQYYDMNCALCSDSFGTLHEAIRHYRRRHQQAGYLSCCGKKVYRRCMALDHIQKHQNPERHRCPHCDKLYTSQTTLRSHMKRHSGEVVESPRLLVCDQCPEQFATQPALARHKRLEHNEAATKLFGCDICGKL